MTRSDPEYIGLETVNAIEAEHGQYPEEMFGDVYATCIDCAEASYKPGITNEAWIAETLDSAKNNLALPPY